MVCSSNDNTDYCFFLSLLSESSLCLSICWPCSVTYLKSTHPSSPISSSSLGAPSAQAQTILQAPPPQAMDQLSMLSKLLLLTTVVVVITVAAVPVLVLGRHIHQFYQHNWLHNCFYCYCHIIVPLDFVVGYCFSLCLPLLFICGHSVRCD